MPDKTKTYSINDLKRIAARDFLSIYANNTQATRTFYDLRLIFGQVMGMPQGEPIIEDRVSITMAWEHVRPLRDLLDRMITAYEAEAGPARVIKPEPEIEEKSPKSDE